MNMNPGNWTTQTLTVFQWLVTWPVTVVFSTSGAHSIQYEYDMN